MRKSEKKKTTISVKIFLASLSALLAISAIFSGYEMYRDVLSTREATDARMKTAAYGIREILPMGYHDRTILGNVSDEEFAALRQRLRDYRRRTGLSYLYALQKFPDGTIRFTLDADNNGKFEKCKKPTELIEKAFATSEVQIGQDFDEQVGENLRTVLVPNLSPEGNFFLTGADIELKFVREEIAHVATNFILLIGFGILFTSLLTYFISKKISAPIRGLSEFTIKLAENDFNPDTNPDKPIEAETAEVESLAKNISLMRVSLSNYIQRLKTAVSAKERAESELKIAGNIQKSFLPEGGMEDARLSIYGEMKPAREAGGDLFDYIRGDDGNLWFAIGDVSGKGMPAAIFMSRAITLARSCAENKNSVVDVARIMNAQLCKNNDTCMFVTFFVGTYNADTRIMKFVNCGHNPPYLKRDGKAQMLNIKANKILGVFEEAEFEEEEIELKPSDIIMLHTDGVNEASNAREEFFGDENTRQLLLNADLNASPKEICNAAMEKICEFEKGCEQSDDITIMCLRIK